MSCIVYYMSTPTDSNLAALVLEAGWRPAEQRAIAAAVLADTYATTAGFPSELREAIAAQMTAGAAKLEAEGAAASAELARRAARGTTTHLLPYIR